jgi:hypothetical protein
MQEIVSSTTSHTLAVDITKNRIYCTITGQDNLPEITTFFHEWTDAMHLVSGKFTVLNDVSQAQTLTLDWVTKLTYIRKVLLQKEPGGIAEVFPENIAEKIKSPEMKKIFTNRHEAEAWLDSQAVTEEIIE